MSARHTVVSLFCVLAIVGCDQAPTSPSPTRSPSTPPTAPYSQIDLRVGTGEEAVNGMMAMVFYTGWLYDPSSVDGKGKLFDTNVGGPWTHPFILGAGQVSPGWDRGVLGMRVGGIRRLVVPPDLGYGGRLKIPEGVPANSTFVYEIELDDCWEWP